jgi:hypothetical protein
MMLSIITTNDHTITVTRTYLLTNMIFGADDPMAVIGSADAIK